MIIISHNSQNYCFKILENFIEYVCILSKDKNKHVKKIIKHCKRLKHL